MKSYLSTTIIQDILDKTEQEIAKMPSVNILVVGKTGVGKSTLINHLFKDELAATGVGQPVTSHMQKITKKTVPLTLYDTRGLELEESVQHEITSDVFELIKQKQGTDEAIHLVYYCVHAWSNRLETVEVEFINQLATYTPVILVLTQSIDQGVTEFQEVLSSMSLTISGIQPVMAQPYRINEQLTIDQFGLQELLNQSFQVIPDTYHTSLNHVQIVDIPRKALAARKWVKGYIATTFSVGFTPIPFADASLLVPMQVTMLAHITAIFGLSIDKSTLVSLIGAVGGTTSATFLGRSIVSNALKLVPGAGTVVGGIISGATASAVTSALGLSYIEVLTFMMKQQEHSGVIDLKKLRHLMKEYFKKQLTIRHQDEISHKKVTEISLSSIFKSRIKRFWSK